METDLGTMLLTWGASMVALIGGVVARDRYVLRELAEGDQRVRNELTAKSDVLHERINKTRDEFVRRDDLDGHLGRIENNLMRMHEEQKGTNKRLDDFITAVLQHGKSDGNRS